MTTQTNTSLELGDIQAAALMPRPNPYAGAYVAVRLDDPAAEEALKHPALKPLLEQAAD